LESGARCGDKVEFNTLEIDWKKFILGEDVSEVSVDGTSQKLDREETGVKLVMSGHRRVEWHAQT